jgi:hypothetical protein
MANEQKKTDTKEAQKNDGAPAPEKKKREGNKAKRPLTLLFTLTNADGTPATGIKLNIASATRNSANIVKALSENRDVQMISVMVED